MDLNWAHVVRHTVMSPESVLTGHWRHPVYDGTITSITALPLVSLIHNTSPLDSRYHRSISGNAISAAPLMH